MYCSEMCGVCVIVDGVAASGRCITLFTQHRIVV